MRVSLVLVWEKKGGGEAFVGRGREEQRRYGVYSREFEISWKFFCLLYFGS